MSRYLINLPQTCVALALVLAVAGFSMTAHAAGSSSDSSSGGSSGGYGSSYSGVAAISAGMRNAGALIKREDYAAALMLLETESVENPDNADVWNLIGYSSRKLGDYTASEIAYDKALSIDPEHKGALEYKGELYLTLGNLDGAKALLVRLKKACSFNCSEVDDLKDVIAKYESSQ